MHQALFLYVRDEVTCLYYHKKAILFNEYLAKIEEEGHENAKQNADSGLRESLAAFLMNNSLAKHLSGKSRSKKKINTLSSSSPIL